MQLYSIIKLYMILYQFIKYKNIRLQKYVMQEIFIIFQILTIQTPKYMEKMLKYVYILDIFIANLML